MKDSDPTDVLGRAEGDLFVGRLTASGDVSHRVEFDLDLANLPGRDSFRCWTGRDGSRPTARLHPIDTAWIAVLVVVAASIMLAAGSAAQAPGLETGLHYFAVEELDTHTVVQRGQAGSLGVAFSRLILGPNTRYRIWILQAASLRVGSIEITTPRPGIRVSLPAIQIRLPNPYDSDNDGLHDTGEFILGTIASDDDSDDDGIRDGAEVVQGSDPLDGIASATGLI